MKRLASVLAPLALGLAPLAAAAADVVIPEPNYSSGQATAYAVKAIIEEALGLEVEMVNTTAVPVIWEAMAKGAGDIDIWTETWLPNQAGLVEQYVKDAGTVVMSENSFPAVQGYCVTRVTVDEHGIASVFDLASPEAARLFDRNGDGRGELWVGPQGWQSVNIETIRARDYGLADFYELQSTDEAVANAGLAEADRAGEPWVGYCYGPHQNFAQYDIVLLEEPPYNPDDFVMVQPNEDPAWQEKSHVASAYEDGTVHISWSASLAERQPALVTLLSNIQLSDEDVNDWSLQIVNGTPPQEVAEAWVAENADQVAGWLAE
ncbi:glycine betaine ABC transporter substrate-binding protein [Paracoccus sp. S-4012]|uniref:ABC transporter substrate-binding protein n=1 Tax=Paracoccus sp. S-4012 TaxID=2665648 RepID=UPI0018A216DB